MIGEGVMMGSNGEDDGEVGIKEGETEGEK